MGSQDAVLDYGWRTTESFYLTKYLQPEIMRIVKPLGAKSILDLGCGNGKLCGVLQDETEASVVGIDPDSQGIEIAQAAYPEIKFFKYGVGSEPKELLERIGEPFDLVVSTEVVEHLYAPRLLPEYAREVLKPGGKLIVSTPYHGYFKNLALALLGKWDHHHDPLWEGGHIKFWSKATLEKLMHSVGFKTIAFSGVGRCRYLWMSMIVVFEKQ